MRRVRRTAFYKDDPDDKIMWAAALTKDDGIIRGEHIFSFDGKKVYQFTKDYPHNLTPEELEIFRREAPDIASEIDDD